MQKGYPPDKRGFVNSACKRMNNKLVVIFPTSYGRQVCALNEDEAVAAGLELCNRYRSSVGLPPLDRFFREARPVPQERQPESKKESDKERRSREYYEMVKKWMDDQELS